MLGLKKVRLLFFQQIFFLFCFSDSVLVGVPNLLVLHKILKFITCSNLCTVSKNSMKMLLLPYFAVDFGRAWLDISNFLKEL